MKRIQPLKMQLLAFLVLSASCYFLIPMKTDYFDLTSHRLHSIHSNTAQLLDHLPELTVTLVSHNADIQQKTQFIIDKWKKHHSQLHFTIRKKPLDPNEQAQWKFVDDGVIFQTPQGSKAIDLSTQVPLEDLLIQGLYQSSRQQDKWIVFLVGHGEPHPYQEGLGEYSEWAKSLKNEGYHVQALNLAQTGTIPSNVNLVVLTSPKIQWLPKETKLLNAYVKKGGNLLWLNDFRGKPLNDLSKTLGVHPLKGIIVDQNGVSMGTPHPAITIVTDYDAKWVPANQTLTAFPWAQALSVELKPDLDYSILMQTHDHSWVSKDTYNGAIQSKAKPGEVKGPLPLGILIKNTRKPNQKIIVIGNHRFVSNAAFHQYGNATLISNFVHTLNYEKMNAVSSSEPQDLLIAIPQFYLLSLKLGQWLAPLLLLLTGLAYFRRLKRSA